MNRFGSYILKYFLFFIVFAGVFSSKVIAQLVVTPTGTAASLTAKLAGPGITIVSDTLICNTLANGTFVSTSTPIASDSGVILSTGKVSQAAGAEAPLTSTNLFAPGDADLLPFVGTATSTYDACQLIIHFVPHGDTVSFRYQFASEEYRQSTCGDYNDGFAFFISGPGVSATLPGVNMALVPGTTIPVAVNSVNSGVIGTTPGCTLANCTSMGPGSPFTAYYINNAGGTQIAYRGITDVFTAKHSVTPCDTYRIKMSIVDAGNGLYDSGVFIEAGSLKANTYHFDRNDSIGYTVAGLPHTIVKGCHSDTIRVVSSFAVSYPTTLTLSYTGTAVSGVDYSTLPPAIIIPAGDTVASIVITGLTTPVVGTQSLNILLSASSACGNIDSISVNILDHPAADILTADTSVCTGAAVPIVTTGTSNLVYNWSPATGLSSATSPSPIATPSATTSYTMTATLPGSMCPSIIDSITVATVTAALNILTSDTTICEGSSFIIRVNGGSGYTYLWTPAAGLNNPTIAEPTASPFATTVYTLTATVPGVGCIVSDSITVTVIPSDFAIQIHDTTICEGAILALNASVNPPTATYTYSWTGPLGYSSVLQNPVVTTSNPNNAGVYTVAVTANGLCTSYAYEAVTIYPTPSDQILGPDLTFCQYSPALSLSIPHYNNLVWYLSPDDSISSVAAPIPNTEVLGVQHFYAAQISFGNNCIGHIQDIDVNIVPCCNGTLFVPSAFTPNNDGRNDVLKVIKSAEYKIDEFNIYNRWGNLVFKASGDNISWDGTVDGRPADVGTYYYTMTANCVNSDKQQLVVKGDITLLR